MLIAGISNGTNVLRKHNGLERLRLVFVRAHNVLKLLLRIFELKIKFSFYDLPCSFPIKHSVSFYFIFSLFKLLSHSLRWFGWSFARSCVRFNGLHIFVCLLVCCCCYIFLYVRARIPGFATVRKKNFWLTKISGHINVLQLRNKGQTQTNCTQWQFIV